MAHSLESALDKPAGPGELGLASEGRSDRVFRVTRWLATFIIPFLVVAFVLLYLFPGDTERHFAWTIRPTLTPMVMGAGYIAGAYFFLRVLTAAQWHLVGLGFPAVATFATVMAIATVLHWDRFNHSHVSFWAWAALYATTPFLVVAAWLNNRRVDPREPSPGEPLIPTALRVVVGVAGLIHLLTGALLLLLPELMISSWPWQLTPLTARILSGWFALPGVVFLMVASDARWSSARVILQSQILGIALVIVAVGRAWGELNVSSPMTAPFVSSLAVLIVGLIGLYVSMEARRGGHRSGDMLSGRLAADRGDS